MPATYQIPQIQQVYPTAPPRSFFRAKPNPGEVIQFDINLVEKIPQIGWNNVKFLDEDHFLVQGIPNNSFYYFVHSFYGIPENKKNIIGMTQYGDIQYGSMLAKDNIVATQFHPEKSSKNGIKMYQNFIDYCKK